MRSFRLPATCVLLIGIVLPLISGKASAAELDKYGGTTAIKGEATGFFHIEQIDGRHWFITPDGNAFFAVALSHMLSGESDVACQNVYSILGRLI